MASPATRECAKGAARAIALSLFPPANKKASSPTMQDISVPHTLRRICDRFLSKGVQPHQAVEDISCLIILKWLDDQDTRREASIATTGGEYQPIFSPAATIFRWNSLFHLSREDEGRCLSLLKGPIMQWLRTVPGIGEFPGTFSFALSDASFLHWVMEQIEMLFSPVHLPLTLGERYRDILNLSEESRSTWAARGAKFFTPRHLARLMCELVRPQTGETIGDPSCGSGRLLAEAYLYTLEHEMGNVPQWSPSFRPELDLLSPKSRQLPLLPSSYFGYDVDATLARQAYTLLSLYGAERISVEVADTLSNEFSTRLSRHGGDVGPFDAILSNPPFNVLDSLEDLAPSLRDVRSTKSAGMFLALILQMLKTGGRAGVIVPENLLFDRSSAAQQLRRRLLDTTALDAVISLPSRVFLPYTGAKTSLLLFRTGRKTRDVWFYDVAADGFSLSARRDARPWSNDLWDLVLKYHLRQTDLGFQTQGPSFVSREQWQEWSALDPGQRSLLYASPSIEADLVIKGSAAAGARPSNHFQGVQTMELPQRKDWTMSRDVLAENEYCLSANFYRPLPPPPPPATVAEIAAQIRSLMDISRDIQAGLSRLEDLLAESKRADVSDRESVQGEQS